MEPIQPSPQLLAHWEKLRAESPDWWLRLADDELTCETPNIAYFRVGASRVCRITPDDWSCTSVDIMDGIDEEDLVDEGISD
jgi:hypothetical protein